MVTVYTFKAADITAANNAGVILKLNGVNVVAGSKFSDSDALTATCNSGKAFYIKSGETTASINFGGFDDITGDYIYTNPTFNTDKTVATFIPTVGKTFSEFECKTVSVAIPLAWDLRPSAGTPDTDILFTWSGGDITVAPKLYNIIVSNGSTEVVNLSQAGTSYKLNKQAGDYTISIYDKGGKTDPTASVITQSISLVAAQKKLLYTLTNADISLLSTNEVEYKINGALAVEGSEIRLDDICVAKVSGSRKFYNEPSELYTSINFTIWDDISGNVNYLSYTLSNNDQTATFTATDNSGTLVSYGSNSFKCDTRIETPSIAGNNNVYKITQDTLTQINKERFTATSSDSPVYDYGQYIISVLQFPFDIPADIIGGSSKIQLADKELQATGIKLLDDTIKINMGIISVPDIHQNMLSFAGVNAIIHLPLAPSIVLDLEYVIGQNIQIYYLLDCYTGKATINITSTKVDGIISSTQVDIGIKIPYMANAYTAPENTGVIAGGDNGVKFPYIELISHDAILPNGFFTVPVVDESLISGQSGFIKIDNVELETSALGNEKAQIISLLNSGVIIK